MMHTGPEPAEEGGREQRIQPLTDRYGRVWEYWPQSSRFTPLYIHDQMAWTREAVLSGNSRLPSPSLKNNPNYRLCAICTKEW